MTAKCPAARAPPQAGSLWLRGTTMTKLTRFLIVAAILGSMAGGAYAAWVFRDKLSGGPPPVTPERAEYDRFVGHLGGNEPAVRDELNYLTSTASAPLGAADRTRANGLTRE